MSMDYQDELKNLQEHTGDFWKPKAGQHKIVALSELTDAPPFTSDDGKEQPRAEMKISIAQKEFLWTIPKGRTPASTYGQLVALGAKKNKLTGEQFTVVVVGEGQNIRYTIVE